MQPSNINWLRTENSIKTYLFLGIMIGLMGLLGYSLFGLTGLIYAAILGGFTMYWGQRVPTEFILRLYRGRPLQSFEAPQIHRITQWLSQQARLSQIPRLYYIPSRGINAFATGREGDTAIAVTDGLIRHLNEREVAGVLAHEVSHIRNQDLKWSRMAMVVNRLTRTLAFLGQLMLFIYLPLLLVGEPPISLIALILLMVTPFISNILQLAISRTREVEADLEAVNLTNDPEGLASALERIDWLNQGGWMGWLRPGGNNQKRELKVPSWLRTHPSLQERVKRLRNLV
jgi:heat shock protein HtpX